LFESLIRWLGGVGLWRLKGKIKRSQPSAAPTGLWGVSHFIAGEKKGLAKQDLS